MVILAIASLNGVYAQKKEKKEVLFTIDNTPYYTDEFKRIYSKNLELIKDDSQKDLDNYLDLYLAYKLKVNKAYKLGLDKDPNHIKELNGYREQLAQNYFVDTKVTKELVDEAYQRSLKEVRASHILIRVPENAPATDTLKAYQKIMDIRKKITGGLSFADAAKQYSEDPSVKDNLGDLGYFSVFKMVYPFESAAYKTQKGNVSEPVRTQFGYHLIKVEDIRDNRGEVSVAHIMLRKNEEEVKPEKIKEKINSIYTKLQQGESFEDMATQFSEDKNSASMKGELPKFASGQLNVVEFEDAAFSLQNPGDYTKPFETKFGWHIVKLIQKYPQKSQEEAKAEIEARVKRDMRSKQITNAITDKLKKKYSYKVDDKVMTFTLAEINNLYYTQPYKLPENIDPFNKVVLKIENRNISAIELLNYIQNEQSQYKRIDDLEMLRKKIADDFVNESLKKYYKENLENEYDDFKYTVQEYKEGLLLFDLMNKEIWEKAKNDSIGQEKFYQQNKQNYMWDQRVDAIVASSVIKSYVEKTREYFLQGESVEFIQKQLNVDDKINIMIDQKLYEEKSNGIPKDYKLAVGVSEIYKEGDYYYVVNAKQITPKTQKTLDEARTRVINDYQQYLEQNWVNALKEEQSYKIDQKVFKKVKKQINK